MPADKLFNRNFVLLCISNLFLGLSFFMALPVLPLYLTGELGASKSLAGVIVALYAFAALLGRPFSGAVVDSFPRKPVLVLTTLLFVCVSTGYIFVVNLVMFGLLRLAHGLIFSISGTSLNTVAVESMPPARLGTGVGLFGVITSLSMALAPMLGITIMDNVSYTMVFAASSLCAGLSLLMILPLRLPDMDRPRREGPMFSAGNLVLKQGLIVAFCSVLAIFPYGLLTNYVSLLARERGLESSAGLFFLCLAGGMVLSRAVSGWLLDRGLLGKVILAGQAVVVAAFAWFVPGADRFSFLSAGLGLGLGFGLLMPAFQTLLIRLAGKNHIGTANSTYYLSMDLGIGMAALSGGFLADLTSLPTTYGIGACLVLLSMALFLGKGRKLTESTGAKVVWVENNSE